MPDSTDSIWVVRVPAWKTWRMHKFSLGAATRLWRLSGRTGAASAVPVPCSTCGVLAGAVLGKQLAGLCLDRLRELRARATSVLKTGRIGRSEVPSVVDAPPFRTLAAVLRQVYGPLILEVQMLEGQDMLTHAAMLEQHVPGEAGVGGGGSARRAAPK
jgi:hypothetical protein